MNIHFVTGRLAEYPLRKLLEGLAPQVGFAYSVGVLPITVAAMMRADWVARRIAVPPGVDKVLLPGYCDGDLRIVEAAAGVPVERGPKDLRQLPEFFGQRSVAGSSAGEAYDIEIVAEINHCPRRTLDDILEEAQRLTADGADLIDVGCEPNETWSGVADCVWALRDQGYRVSIDSLNPLEVERAICAGAEMVLSVNATNREAARDWDAELVVIPDDAASLAGLDETVEVLAAADRRVRLDPILQPIGLGLADSLARYVKVRQRYPEAEMLMGVANLTELTDADSAALNLLLLGFCQELGIRRVLTTQVIHWAKTSVRECDVARRMVYRAVAERMPPKRMDSRLIMLRDDRLQPLGPDTLEQLARQIKDHNYRIFAEGGALHLISAGLHLADANPFRLFVQLMETGRENLDPSHTFYLGYELAKAKTALTLGKEYRQDQPLDWGMLTEAEDFVRLKGARGSQRTNSAGETENGDAADDARAEREGGPASP